MPWPYPHRPALARCPDYMNPENVTDRLNDKAVSYVYVAGAPYCGSTLLSFLMNAHPECVCLGESFGLLKNIVVEEYRCSCGELLAACPYWKRLVQRVGDLGEAFDVANRNWKTRFTVGSNRYVNRLVVDSLGSDILDDLRGFCLRAFRGIRHKLDRAGKVNAIFARAALDVSGKRVFVDASKVAHRIPLLARVDAINLRVIHLVREARGGTASIMKHRALSDSAAAARYWRRRNLETDRARRYLPADRWLCVRYSELCADPQGVMDGIMDFIGVSHSPIPVDFRAVDHHIIGNQMRLGGVGEIREDLSWKGFLAESDLTAIARVSGSTNRRFGYDWLEGT